MTSVGKPAAAIAIAPPCRSECVAYLSGSRLLDMAAARRALVTLVFDTALPDLNWKRD